MALPNRPSNIQGLSKAALCTLDDAKAYLKRSTDDDDPMITALVNEASAVIGRYCQRHLKSQLHDGATGNQPPFIVRGSGTSKQVLPEWPLTALTSVEYASDPALATPTSSAGWAALSTIGWFEDGSGVLLLPNDVFPKNGLVRVKATCGYVSGVHDHHLMTLRAACKRMVQIMYQDWDSGIGRGTGFSVAGQAVNLVDHAIPKDVESMLAPYVRLL